MTVKPSWVHECKKECYSLRNHLSFFVTRGYTFYRIIPDQLWKRFTSNYDQNNISLSELSGEESPSSHRRSVLKFLSMTLLHNNMVIENFSDAGRRKFNAGLAKVSSNRTDDRDEAEMEPTFIDLMKSAQSKWNRKHVIYSTNVIHILKIEALETGSHSFTIYECHYMLLEDANITVYQLNSALKKSEY